MGFYAPATGFTRVLQTLLEAAAERWDVHWVGLGPLAETTTVGPLTVHPVRAGGGDVFGAYAASALAETLAPQVVFILHDVWHLGRYARVLRPALGSARLVAYFPLDGRIVDPQTVAPLAAYDRLITYTPGAREDLLRAAASLGQGLQLPRVDVLPHGVDLATFQAAPELVAGGFDPAARSSAKRRVFPGLETPADSFIVLNPSRPATRKRLDLTLEAFALFARGKPAGVRLCLHQAITRRELRDGVLAQAATCGIADRLELDPLGSRRLTDVELAEVYRACDVGLTTTMGEGWGLVAFEHAACGGAQVMPRHSACGELWDDAADLVEPARRYVPAFSPFEMGEVAPTDVAAALERLYADRGRLRSVAAQSHARVGAAAPPWTEVGARFRDTLESP